jgi:hypothetical protein
MQNFVWRTWREETTWEHRRGLVDDIKMVLKEIRCASFLTLEFLIHINIGFRCHHSWHVLRLRMGEKASRFGRWLRIYWITSRGQSKRGGPAAWGLGGGQQLILINKPACYEIYGASVFNGFLAGSCEHGNEPSDSIKGSFLTIWETISFSRRTLFHGVSYW